MTLANRAALAAELHRSVGASVVLSGADVSRVGLSEAQAERYTAGGGEDKWKVPIRIQRNDPVRK